MAKKTATGEARNEIILTGNQFAQLLNLSTRRVQQLAEEGVFVKAGRGKYKLFESVPKYINSLQEKAGDSGGNVDYFKERALHEKAKREKAEIELSVMRGDVHRSEDVKYVMTDMLAAFRSRCLALPAKLAPQLVGKQKLPVILELLTAEVNDALKELSGYDPQVFLARNADYVELNGDEEDSD